jgi:hypothetical protein
MYKFRIEGKKIPVRINSNLSLSEACLKIENVEGGLVLGYDNSLVAFWCAFDKKVKIGFGAKEYEKDILRNLYLI